MHGTLNGRASAVITGVGYIGAAGAGRDALARILASGVPPLGEVDRSEGFHVDDAARRAALVGPVDLRRWIAPLKARRMSPPSRYTVAAAVQALEEAGVEILGDGDPGVGVAVATSFGPVSYTQRLIDQILDEGAAAASPAVFTECVANAPAAQVSIQCRARGPNLTVSLREAGPLVSLGRMADLVARGSVRVGLAGTVDEITPLLHSILDRFGALSRPRPALPEAARPFDRRRNGCVAADGATVALLETEESARSRGVPVLARVAGWTSAFDPTARRTDWGRGEEALAGALSRMLERAGHDPEDVDLIVSGASGSIAGDRLEAATLKRLWGSRRLPPVLAPKAVTGEFGGGFLAAAVLAASGDYSGATPGFEEPDPELGIIPHDGGSLGRRPRNVLVSSLAVGGAVAWMLIQAGSIS